MSVCYKQDKKSTDPCFVADEVNKRIRALLTIKALGATDCLSFEDRERPAVHRPGN